MPLTLEMVQALAPDDASLTAGSKLAAIRHWHGLGSSEDALWGECQGSARYLVQVALPALAVRCTCPSRKRPCKHSVGLLLLAARDPQALPAAEPPAWVAEWLAKRRAAAAPKAPRKANTAAAEADRAKRAARRMHLMLDGLRGLDRWLEDLVRQGLAGIGTEITVPWEAQAARLIDAQAPGLATRVRRLAYLPRASADWQSRLLAELGRIALLSHAFQHLGELDPALGEDVRQLVGWYLTAEEVAERGEHVRDDWLVLGQWIEESERFRTQHTWLIGAGSARSALILQFSVLGAPFEPLPPPGTQVSAEVAFWPGTASLRARFVREPGPSMPIAVRPPGSASIAAFLNDVASALGRQPWQDRRLCVLDEVVPVFADEGDAPWHVCDREGSALPLRDGEHWQLLALAGGAPVTVAGEWEGERLRPLGVYADGSYTVLEER